MAICTPSFSHFTEKSFPRRLWRNQRQGHFHPLSSLGPGTAQMTRNWINVSWRKAMEPRDSWRTNTLFPAETNRGNENRRNGGWTNSCSTTSSTILKRSEIVLYYLTWPRIIQQHRNLVTWFQPPWKIQVIADHHPKYTVEHKHLLKPPTRYFVQPCINGIYIYILKKIITTYGWMVYTCFWKIINGLTSPFLCLEDSHLLRLEPLAPPFFPLAAGA